MPGSGTRDPVTTEASSWIEVEVLEAWGSTPRAAGTCMWISADASQGSIGGGRLEWLAMQHARALLEDGAPDLPWQLDLPLGPTTHQCCGGYVRLGFRRAQSSAEPDISGEPLVYLHGQGHVGQAAAAALAPLPIRVLRVESRPGFPSDQNDHSAAIGTAPAGAWHIVMTHDHALDLEICAQLLQSDCSGHIGLIGSQSKRTRFFKQLRLRGLDPAPIVCPIGLAGIRGKEPAIIAASLAAELLALRSALVLRSHPHACEA